MTEGQAGRLPIAASSKPASAPPRVRNTIGEGSPRQLASPDPPHRRGALGHKWWIPYVYLAPALALFAAFIGYPFARSIWISMLDWDGISPPSVIGLQNYASVFTDSGIRTGFLRALVLVFFYSTLPILFGLTLAAILGSTRLRGAGVLRTILFFPYVLPLVVVAVTWKWILAPAGPLNGLLNAVGLGGLARAWLGDFTYALPAVGLVGTWVVYGFAMLLFIAGVQKIPSDLYDAARVDGAGALRVFRAVTLPGLRRELLVVTVVTIISALRTFDVIWVTTRGGPGFATTVPALDVFRRAFRQGDVGQATAIGLVLAVIVFAVVVLVVFVFGRADTDDR